MTTAAEWTALADRVQAVTIEPGNIENEVANRRLGADILTAMGYREGGRFLYDPDGGLLFRVPDMLGSMDDAMKLIPTDGTMRLLDVSFGWEPSEPAVWPAASLRWYPPRKEGKDWHANVVSACTLALTIAVAGLRLRAEHASEQEA